MKVYLIHHATAFKAEEDPERHLTPLGRDQADRLGARLAAAGVDPVRILHSDKQWVMETAERIAAAMGMQDRTAVAGYDINTGDDLSPFLSEIDAADGDIMMVGHVDYLRRAAAKLVAGDENVQVIAFKPDFGTAFCLEDEDGDWIVRFGWRQEHLTD
ncbi:MAG: histidine phosphatase family protein [Alphaproteobacteria bacterium]